MLEKSLAKHKSIKTAAVLLLAIVLSFAIAGCGNLNPSAPPEVSQIKYVTSSAQFDYTAGKDITAMKFIAKDSKGTEVKTSTHNVTPGKKTTIKVNELALYNGTYTAYFYEKTAASDFVPVGTTTGYSFERTGNPAPISAFLLNGTQIVYTPAPGKSLTEVKVVLTDKNGNEVMSETQNVTAGSTNTFETAEYKSRYDGIVSEKEAGKDFTQVGSSTIVDNRAAFAVSGVSVSDVYTGADRSTKATVTADGMTEAKITLSGTGISREQTYSGAQLLIADGSAVIDITALMTGINGLTVNVTVTAKNTDTTHDTIKDGTASKTTAFAAASVPVVAQAMPTFNSSSSGYSASTQSLNLIYSAPLTNVESINPYLGINGTFTRINRSTGAEETVTITGTLAAPIVSPSGSATVSGGAYGIGIALTNTNYNYSNFNITITSNSQSHVAGAPIVATYTTPIINGPVVTPATYAELQTAVQTKIYNGLASTHRPSSAANINILIDTNGTVHAYWEAGVGAGNSVKGVYAEYTIPNAASSNTFRKWVDNTAYMSVNPQPSTANFADGGTLDLSGAQTLFNQALAKGGSTSEKQTFTGAQVVMVKQATNSGNNMYSVYVEKDGAIYQSTFGYAGGVPVYNVSANTSERNGSFGISPTPLTLLDSNSYAVQGLVAPMMMSASVANGSATVRTPATTGVKPTNADIGIAIVFSRRWQFLCAIGNL